MIVLGYTGYARDPQSSSRSPLITSKNGFNELFEYRHGEVPFPLFPLGFLGHDGAAALVIDGRPVACAAEERFTRVKHGLNLAGRSLLPRNAVAWCLETAGISLHEVDTVAHFCDFREGVTEDRLSLLEPHLGLVDREKTAASYRNLYESMLSPRAVRDQFERMTGQSAPEIVPVRHHLAHAASAYYASGFEESLILTLDGTGERESSILAVGRRGLIEEIDRTLLPTSLGTLYLIITVFLGFRSLGDEFKVMGLAGYGEPSRYRGFFDHLLETGEECGYSTRRMTAPGFRDLLEEHLGEPRASDDPIEARHQDIAAALQEALANAVVRQLRDARRETGLTNLSLAGGVTLNCALNGEIVRSGLFDEVFVQPAAGDEGASVGAALLIDMKQRGEFHPRRWADAFLGPGFTDHDILSTLRDREAELTWEAHEDISAVAANEVARGGIIGWFQGRMEFGPRALGNRSILADPRDPKTSDRVNRRIKFREPFRPFAPAVLLDEADTWFDMTGLVDSPFMLFTVPVRLPERIPAVTHVDGTARVQTVTRKTNPLFYRLIEEFRRETGVPVVLNTSFNVKGEPIVCCPEDAVRCFLGTALDGLAIGRFFVRRREA